jgi:hypothetical protein
MKRLVSVTFLLIALIVGVSGLNIIIAPIGFNALIDDFRGAVVRGDAAAVRALAFEPDAAQIWETLRSRNVDKAREVVMRGGGYSTSTWFGQMVGYTDLTARLPDGTSVLFRIDLIRGFIIFGQGWRIKSATVDQ